MNSLWSKFPINDILLQITEELYLCLILSVMKNINYSFVIFSEHDALRNLRNNLFLFFTASETLREKNHLMTDSSTLALLSYAGDRAAKLGVFPQNWGFERGSGDLGFYF